MDKLYMLYTEANIYACIHLKLHGHYQKLWSIMSGKQLPSHQFELSRMYKERVSKYNDAKESLAETEMH